MDGLSEVREKLERAQGLVGWILDVVGDEYPIVAEKARMAVGDISKALALMEGEQYRGLLEENERMVEAVTSAMPGVAIATGRDPMTTHPQSRTTAEEDIANRKPILRTESAGTHNGPT